MRLSSAIAFSFALLCGVTAAQAQGCPGNPGAMGTSRVLHIDPREYPRIGTVQYQDTLPLNDKEVVLTFDDGPMPPYTNRVLEALAHECVKANYFIVGRMARGYPDLLRRIHAEGHVIGTHSENHPLAFEKMPLRAVQAEIDQGFASTTAALGGQGTVAPFFRIPGLLRADMVEQYLRMRSMVTWSADVVADDWKHITASEVVSRSLARLDAKGKGILLLHDIQPATALAIPHLLRELKRRGYKIVQVAPASAAALVAGTQRKPAAKPAAVASVEAAEPPRQQPQPPARETSSWPTPYPAQSPAPSAIATAQPEPTAPAATASRAAPAIAPKPIEPAAEPAAIQAATRALSDAFAGEPATTPPGRAMPAPMIEAARVTPRTPQALPQMPVQAALARPLTPGFKPSHSASLPTKIDDVPIEAVVAAPPASQAPPAQAPASQAPVSLAPAAHAPLALEPPVLESQALEPRSPDVPGSETQATEPPSSPPERQIDSWSTRASLAPPARPLGGWPVTASSLGPARPR